MMRDIDSKYNFLVWIKITPIHILLLVLLIGFYRKPDGFLNPQFFAEDGAIFFKYCYVHGFRSIFMSFAGYMHLIPRLIAYAASFFPLSIVPILYNYFALASVLFVCYRLFNSRLKIPHKPLFSLAVVLVPCLFHEFMTITNIQMFIAPLLLVVFLQSPPKTKIQGLSDYIMLVLVGLTGPFIVFVLPLFILKYINNKTTYNLGICLAVIMLTFVQGYYILTCPTNNELSGEITVSLHQWISVFGLRLFGDMFFGRQISLSINPFILAILGIICPILLIVLTGIKKEKLYLVCTFLYFGITIALATLFKFRSCIGVLIPHFNGPHYFYLLYLMVMWSLIVCLKSSHIKKHIAGVMLILMILASFTYFQSEQRPDYKWRDHCKNIKKEVPIKIPIDPTGWYIKLYL